jgi:hypothetical protein
VQHTNKEANKESNKADKREKNWRKVGKQEINK